MQRLDLEERSLSTLRNERIKAYSTLARLTKAIWLEVPGDPLPVVYEALSQVEILSDDPKIKEVAEELVDTWASAWEAANAARLRGASPFDAPGLRNAEDQLVPLRNAFIEHAKAEIKAEAPSREGMPESTPQEGRGGPKSGLERPQSEAPRRPLWRRLFR